MTEVSPEDGAQAWRAPPRAAPGGVAGAAEVVGAAGCENGAELGVHGSVLEVADNVISG
jgi:hypothetical protein